MYLVKRNGFFFFFKFLRSEVGGEAYLSPIELKIKSRCLGNTAEQSDENL